MAILARGAGAQVSITDAAQYRKDLKEIVQTRNANRMLAFIEKLSSLDDPQTVGLLVEAGVVFPSAKNYASVLKAVTGFKEPGTVDELIKISSGSGVKDFRQQLLVLEAFGLKKDEKTRRAVHAALDDKAPLVQVGAIQACRKRLEKEAVPALIEVVAKHQAGRDRTWIEAREALLALTGQDYQTVEDWKKFWDAKKDSLDPAHLDRSSGPTKIVVKKTQDSVEFFGVEIHSQNVVLVVDCSGSMVLYDSDPDFKGKNMEYERQRLTRAKAQCLNVVKKLRGRSRFNVIAFNDKVFPWQKSIVPASSQNLGSAQRFIKKFQSNGWTHTDEALEKAFEDPAIDTIVLLSDGAPAKESAPDFMGLQAKILARVKDLNSSRKLRIDTFGFEGEGNVPKHLGGGRTGGGGGGGGGDNIMVEFLKKLAKENGGEYQSIK